VTGGPVELGLARASGGDLAGRKDVHWPVRLYAGISLAYIALMAWWVIFFARQDGALAALAADAGVPFDARQLEVLSDASGNSSRMLMFEGGFLAVLLLTSVWLVARALRHERRLNQRQRNFLSAVTHELRSPIASARLCIDSILLGRTDEQKTDRYLRLAREDLDRLSGMAEDVLSTRALSEGRAAMRPETVNVADLARRALSSRIEHQAETDVSLSVDAPGPVHVHADPRALGQLIENLVGNAIKYCGERGEVVVRVSSSDRTAVIEVIDDGPGLQGADPEAITQAFVRGGDEQVRTRPGVGLGLYIVEQIVSVHAGRLEFIDAGSGLTVRVELPLADPEENDA
jgi:signal transduction histidine kinase